MAALIVVGSILLFLLLIFLLLLCPIKVTVALREELSLSIQYGPIKIPILPAKKTEKPAKEKKKKPKEEPEQAGEKKPSFFKKLKDQHGVSGLLYLAKGLLKLAGSTMKKLFSHVVVYHLSADIRIGSDDAAQTAIQYGRICAVAEPCMTLLLPLVPKKKRKDVQLYVAPDFTSEVSAYQVYAQVGIRPLFLFSAAFGALFRFIRIYLGAPKREQPAKEAKTEQQTAEQQA